MIKDFICGSIAGGTEILCVYPLDVIKTRRHLCLPFRVHGLYNGLSAALYFDTPRRGLKLSLQNTYKNVFNNDRYKASRDAMAGICTGITESVITTPFELAKIRMQMSASPLSCWTTLHTIYNQESARGLYRGFLATVLRGAVWNSVFFHLVGHLLSDGHHRFTTGMVGGAVATFVNNPIDVVKTRIQTDKNVIHPTIRQCVKEIVGSVGWVGFYRGCMIKIIRQGIGGGILSVVFPFLQSNLR